MVDFLRHELNNTVNFIRLDRVTGMQMEANGQRVIIAGRLSLNYTIMDFDQVPPVEVDRATVNIVTPSQMITELLGSPPSGTGSWVRHSIGSDRVITYTLLDSIVGALINPIAGGNLNKTLFTTKGDLPLTYYEVPYIIVDGVPTPDPNAIPTLVETGTVSLSNTANLLTEFTATPAKVASMYK